MHPADSARTPNQLHSSFASLRVTTHRQSRRRQRRGNPSTEFVARFGASEWCMIWGGITAFQCETRARLWSCWQPLWGAGILVDGRTAGTLPSSLAERRGVGGRVAAVAAPPFSASLGLWKTRTV